MKTFFECIPCFIRQALDAVRLVTDDETVHERLLREVLQAAGRMDLRQSPPAMGQHIHRLIRRLTGESDPYRKAKDQFNRMALELYPNLRARVECSGAPLETALRLAIAGNVIDMGVNAHLDESHVYEAIENALSAPLNGDMMAFSEAMSGARRILYLTDNAGEIVFDRLLLERMLLERVTVVVKGSAVINDATMADAQAAGIRDLVEVIDNGSDAPGTILEDCSVAFRHRFDEAGVVIAKGQGNYETLDEAEKDIFFAFKVKCPVVARDLDCHVGSLILRRSVHGQAAVLDANEIDKPDSAAF
jgi:uncharacterized protein with ATP-grasp and redox domains